MSPIFLPILKCVGAFGSPPKSPPRERLDWIWGLEKGSGSTRSFSTGVEKWPDFQTSQKMDWKKERRIGIRIFETTMPSCLPQFWKILKLEPVNQVTNLLYQMAEAPHKACDISLWSQKRKRPGCQNLSPLGHSYYWTIWSPQNLFLKYEFPLF